MIRFEDEDDLIEVTEKDWTISNEYDYKSDIYTLWIDQKCRKKMKFEVWNRARPLTSMIIK